jgi:hypothetical protein
MGTCRPHFPYCLTTDTTTSVGKILQEEGARLLNLLKETFPDDARDTWSYSDLNTAVQDARRKWESKARLSGGKPQRLFHNLMSKFETHSGLCAIIPTEDKYISVITGGFTILVKSSTSHTKTIAQLNDALEQISEAVAQCDVEATLVRSAAMQNAVMKLYLCIFLFLSDAIRWYNSSSKSKIFNSFHNDYSAGFRAAVERIQHMSRGVQRVQQLGTSAEVRYMRLGIDEMQDEMRGARGDFAAYMGTLADMIRAQDTASKERDRETQQLLRNSEPRAASASPAEEGRRHRQLLPPNNVELPDLMTLVRACTPVNAGASAAPPSTTAQTVLQDVEPAQKEQVQSLHDLIDTLYVERDQARSTIFAPAPVPRSSLSPSQVAIPVNAALSSSSKSPIGYVELGPNTTRAEIDALMASVCFACKNANQPWIPFVSQPRPSRSPLTDIMLSLANQITTHIWTSDSAGAAPDASLPQITSGAMLTERETLMVLKNSLLALEATSCATKTVHAIIDTALFNADGCSTGKDILGEFLSILRHAAEQTTFTANGKTIPVKVIFLAQSRSKDLVSLLKPHEIAIVAPLAARIRPVTLPIIVRPYTTILGLTNEAHN